MTFYIFTRVKGGADFWDLIEEATSSAVADKAMIDYRKLFRQHGGVDVVVMEAKTVELAREKLATP